MINVLFALVFLTKEKVSKLASVHPQYCLHQG